MESWIQFGRGPLFATAFAVMLLGLARLLLLTLMSIAEAYHNSWDRIVNWREVARQTMNWLTPVSRLWRTRPVYSTLSVLFHVGLLLVPLFAAAHVLLWCEAVGFAWKSMPQRPADLLTLLTIATGMGLILGRAGSSASRGISRPQEYFWLVLLLIPFATGFLCSHAAIPAKAYRDLMLLHVYSADLILGLIPFTKIAHCVLAPLSQTVTAVAWKFPRGAGDRVAATLGYSDCPSWVPKARLTSIPRAIGSDLQNAKQPVAVGAPKQGVTTS